GRGGGGGGGNRDVGPRGPARAQRAAPKRGVCLPHGCATGRALGRPLQEARHPLSWLLHGLRPRPPDHQGAWCWRPAKPDHPCGKLRHTPRPRQAEPSCAAQAAPACAKNSPTDCARSRRVGKTQQDVHAIGCVAGSAIGREGFTRAAAGCAMGTVPSAASTATRPAFRRAIVCATGETPGTPSRHACRCGRSVPRSPGGGAHEEGEAGARGVPRRERGGRGESARSGVVRHARTRYSPKARWPMPWLTGHVLPGRESATFEKGRWLPDIQAVHLG
ncbi:unnamed protein product, partial [Prorocentrum cordatum]